MNALPEHRRCITGRTQSRTYYPADYDPIQKYYPANYDQIQGFKPRSSATSERIYGVLLATVIGVCLAAWAVHWWAS